MLTRRKESDTYLAAVSRHHWSLKIAMKVGKMCSFQPALRSLSLQLMKAALLAESYTLYQLSSRSAFFGNVYCQ